MKGLVILGNGFEDTEALAPIDVLKRGKVEIVTATINPDLLVTTQYNHLIQANTLLKDVNPDEYDFLLIPGGRAVNGLLESSLVDKVVNEFSKQNKLIAAICAGPKVLGKNNLLKNKEYTCYPGSESFIDGIKVDKGVVVDGNFITGKSMYYSIEFGLEILSKLMGKDVANQVLNGIKGIAN